jgi:hypothetical protein
MKKIFKKSNHPIWSLVIWFVMAVIIFALIYAGIIGATGGSVFIMVTFFLWPCYLCSKSAIEQLLLWANSANEKARFFLESKWMISNRFDTSKKDDNPAFWKVLNATIFCFWLFLALIAFFCTPWSRSTVYGFSHSVIIIITHMFFSTGWAKASVWVWLLTTVAFIAIIVWYVKSLMDTITKEQLNHRSIVFAVFFVIRRILNYWLLCYTSSMIIASIVFWIVIAILLVVYPIVLAPKVMEFLKTYIFK